MIQEIFGVNGFVRAVADGFASRGYFALAPDLFWRIESNVQLTDKTEEEWKRAFDLMGKFNADSGVKDIQATISDLRHESGVNGKIEASSAIASADCSPISRPRAPTRTPPSAITA